MYYSIEPAYTVYSELSRLCLLSFLWLFYLYVERNMGRAFAHLMIGYVLFQKGLGKIEVKTSLLAATPLTYTGLSGKIVEQFVAKIN